MTTYVPNRTNQLLSEANIQIRAKRLARLAALQKSQAAEAEQNSTTETAKKSKIDQNDSQKKSSAISNSGHIGAITNSSGDLEKQLGTSVTINHKETTSIQTTQDSRSSSTENESPIIATEIVKDPIAAWSEPPEVRLDKWIKSEALHLFDLKTLPDVQPDNEHFDANSIDDFFVEILTVQGVNTPILYLYDVYKRSLALRRTLASKDSIYTAKMEVVKTVTSLCVSYGIICFQVPDMILNNVVPAVVQVFVDRLDTHMFLADIITKADEQESLLDVLDVLAPTLASCLSKMNLFKPDYSKYLSLWESLAAIKPFCANFSQVQGFFPKNPEKVLSYESETLLGCFLKLSPLEPESAKAYFMTIPVVGKEIELSQGELAPIFSTIRLEFRAVLDRIWFIIDKLIRGSARTRQDMMKWFTDLVNLSHLRTGSYSDPRKLPSDELMFNISYIFIRLSMPFLEYPTYSKFDKINPDYFGPLNKILDVKDEARVYSSSKEADEHYLNAMAQDANFITECFYVALAYLHYGLGGVIVNHKKLKKQEERYKSMVEVHQKRMGPQHPMLQSLYHALNQTKCCWWANAALALDPTVNADIFDFVVGCTQFFTRMIDPTHSHPRTKLQIPLFEVEKVSQLDDYEFLKSKAPEPWKYLPEFCVEGIINYCKFLFDFQYNWFLQGDLKVADLAEFLVTLLRCPELVGNPHMKSSIVEILFVGTLDSGLRPGMFRALLEEDVLVKNNLLYSLLDVYVTVEKTGASSQFYDKFNSRYYISSIIEQLWRTDFYKKQLSSYASTKVDFFVRFVARMLNDTTYLFDESFTELNNIHIMQVELQSREAGNPPDEETHGTTEELQEKLESVERRAKSEMGLAKQTMKLFKLFTKQVPEGFTILELVDRLAGMLDYNLSLMVGPKCSSLKVKEPEKYGFDPKEMLADISMVYCNLGKQQKFVEAVARDGRSFDFKLFTRARDILTNRTNTHPETIKQFYSFGEAAEKQRQLSEQEEMELGEVPDELLDPLMYTLMEDPVILPGSRVTIDRSTIKAHLLSDPTDPFNRMPLKLEDVIDDVEMKQRIFEFKAGKASK